MVTSENSPSEENPWKKGMEVEVTSDEDGYTGIWFEATIVRPPQPSSSSSRRKNSEETKKSRIALVKYKTLAPSEAAKRRNTFLQEYIDKSLLRPVPPKDDSNRSESFVFEVDDVVDAYHLDGWWVGVVAQVLISSSGGCDKYRYIVDFENPPDKLELDSLDLRLHLDWVDGRWIKPPKKAKLLEFITPEQLSRNPANNLEPIPLISSDLGASMDITKNNQIDETTLGTLFSTNTSTKRTPSNSYSIISRPSKRSKKRDIPESNEREKIEITPQQTGVLSQTVDAIKESERPPTGHVLYSPASVERTQTSTGTDNEQPVFTSKKSKRKQSNGEIVHQMPSKDCQHTIQTKRSGTPPILVACQKSIVTESDARKYKSDGVQFPITTHDVDQKMELKRTIQTKRRGRISKLVVKKKKCDVIDFDGNGCTFDGVQVPTSTLVNSNGSQDASVGNDASEKDHNMENDSLAITSICYDQPLRILCSEGGILNQLNDAKDTNCTYIDVSHYNQELPFMKRWPFWEMIHSMKEFQMMKQFPHFNDLHNFEEHCREGLAIGKLLVFKNLVTETPNLKLDDPQLLWDNYLKVLLDLEMNGFDVQELKVRYTDMLVIKDRQQRNRDELKKSEILLLEEENKKRKIDEEMEELNEKLRKIEEKRAATMSIKEIQDSKTATSQLATNELLEDIRSTQLEFERVIAAPPANLDH